MPYRLTINGEERSVENGTELTAAVELHRRVKFLEIWIERSVESICLLANGDSAWLMYLKNPDAECFSTRNPEVSDDGEKLEYRLSNGQHDFYPRHWAVTRDQATRALADFVDNGGRTPALVWHDDFAK